MVDKPSENVWEYVTRESNYMPPRLVTVELADRLLRVLTTYEDRVLLHDNHLAVLTAVKENSVRFLRNFYTGKGVFQLFKECYQRVSDLSLIMYLVDLYSRLLILLKFYTCQCNVIMS